MKKVLYYIPIIILVIYLICFPFLQKKLVVLKTPDGEDYAEAFDRAYGKEKYYIEGLNFDPISPPVMVPNHRIFQVLTVAILALSVILKLVFSKKRLEIDNKGKIIMIIFILLFVIICLLTIYTTIINPTAIIL